MEDKEKYFYEIVLKMEAEIGKGNWAQAVQFFTVEFSYRVGNNRFFKGVEGLRSYMEWQNSLVRWVGHDVHLIALKDQNLIVEVTSHFERVIDKSPFSIPCTDIYRFKQDQIYDWRVYTDTSIFQNPI
ncbi:MAG: nuclear transport factor 2 family protein [Bacteroidota bacterium]